MKTEWQAGLPQAEKATEESNLDEERVKVGWPQEWHFIITPSPLSKLLSCQNVMVTTPISSSFVSYEVFPKLPCQVNHDIQISRSFVLVMCLWFWDKALINLNLYGESFVVLRKRISWYANVW